jgi:hypothetical protein
MSISPFRFYPYPLTTQPQYQSARAAFNSGSMALLSGLPERRANNGLEKLAEAIEGDHLQIKSQLMAIQERLDRYGPR